MSNETNAGTVNRIENLDALRGMVGEVLGTSGWMVVDQDRIQAFADATGDHQWIHLDKERAAAESGYGNTVAHGFLTLSLIPKMKPEAFEVDNITTLINYGLDKVRFPHPVTCDSRIRTSFRLMEIEERGPGKALVKAEATVEVEGGDRPACIANLLTLYIV